MADSTYTETTSQSWFGRIGGAIKGILFGVVLVGVAFPFLFWNEGRSVKRYKALKEGAGIVVSVPATQVDPANQGKLIHLLGKADTDAILKDPVFNISENAIHLKRQVEMYQWRENVKTETKNKVGGGTDTVKSYSYQKVWSSSPINSANFKKSEQHQNPAVMPFRSEHYTADQVKLGAFTLTSSLVHQIGDYKPLAVTTNTAPAQGVTVHDGAYYRGADPANPQVGDVRINFTVVKPTDISVIARQAGNSFEPYTTTAGGTIELLQVGSFSAEAMFQSAQEANRMLTWLLRLAGFLLFLFGFNLIFRPLSVLADVVPIMGQIVGVGTGIVALLLSAILALLVISVAWIFYRPLLGVLLLVVAVGLTVVTVKKLKEKRGAALKQ